MYGARQALRENIGHSTAKSCRMKATGLQSKTIITHQYSLSTSAIFIIERSLIGCMDYKALHNSET